MGYYDDDYGFLFYIIGLVAVISIRVSIRVCIYNLRSSNQRAQRGAYTTIVLRNPRSREHLQDGYDEIEHFSAFTDDSVALDLKQKVKNGEWRSIRDTLVGMKVNGRNNEERGSYIGVIVDEIEKTWPRDRTQEIQSFCSFLDQWVESEPEGNSDCFLLRAKAGVAWAWHARSSGTADMVSRQQWELFRERLHKAASDLKVAQSLCPTDPLVYSIGVPMGMGLMGLTGGSMEGHIKEEYLKEKLKKDTQEPLFYEYHVSALQYHCEKWRGTHEIMFNYARSITSQLPDGHPLWVLIPMAHYERNLLRGGSVISYWRQNHVVQEVEQAYHHAFPNEMAETTIQATAPYKLSQEITCRNYFALALGYSGRVEFACRQIRLIGKRPTSSPFYSLQFYKSYIESLGFDANCTSDTAILTAENVHVVPTTENAQAVPTAEIVRAIPTAGYIPVVASEIV